MGLDTVYSEDEIRELGEEKAREAVQEKVGDLSEITAVDTDEGATISEVIQELEKRVATLEGSEDDGMVRTSEMKYNIENKTVEVTVEIDPDKMK